MDPRRRQYDALRQQGLSHLEALLRLSLQPATPFPAGAVAVDRDTMRLPDLAVTAEPPLTARRGERADATRAAVPAFALPQVPTIGPARDRTMLDVETTNTATRYSNASAPMRHLLSAAAGIGDAASLVAPETGERMRRSYVPEGSAVPRTAGEQATQFGSSLMALGGAQGALARAGASAVPALGRVLAPGPTASLGRRIGGNMLAGAPLDVANAATVDGDAGDRLRRLATNTAFSAAGATAFEAGADALRRLPGTVAPGRMLRPSGAALGNERGMLYFPTPDADPAKIAKKFKKFTDEALADKYRSVWQRMDEANAKGDILDGWTRFDPNADAQRSGGTRRQGRAIRRWRDDQRYLGELEYELFRRGFSEEQVRLLADLGAARQVLDEDLAGVPTDQPMRLSDRFEDVPAPTTPSQTFDDVTDPSRGRAPDEGLLVQPRAGRETARPLATEALQNAVGGPIIAEPLEETGRRLGINRQRISMDDAKRMSSDLDLPGFSPSKASQLPSVELMGHLEYLRGAPAKRAQIQTVLDDMTVTGEARRAAQRELDLLDDNAQDAFNRVTMHTNDAGRTLAYMRWMGRDPNSTSFWLKQVAKADPQAKGDILALPTAVAEDVRAIINEGKAKARAGRRGGAASTASAGEAPASMARIRPAGTSSDPKQGALLDLDALTQEQKNLAAEIKRLENELWAFKSQGRDTEAITATQIQLARARRQAASVLGTLENPPQRVQGPISPEQSVEAANATATRSQRLATDAAAQAADPLAVTPAQAAEAARLRAQVEPQNPLEDLAGWLSTEERAVTQAGTKQTRLQTGEPAPQRPADRLVDLPHVPAGMTPVDMALKDPTSRATDAVQRQIERQRQRVSDWVDRVVAGPAAPGAPRPERPSTAEIAEASLPKETLDELLRLVQSRRVASPLWQQVISLRNAGLLSGPKSSAINLLSNTITTGVHNFVERPVAGFYDFVYSALFRKPRSILVPSRDALASGGRAFVHHSKQAFGVNAARAVRAEGGSLMEAGRAAARSIAIQHGDLSAVNAIERPMVKFGVPGQQVQGPTARFLQSYHDFVFGFLGKQDVGYRQWTLALAAREMAETKAINEGLRRGTQEFADRVNALGNIAQLTPGDVVATLAKAADIEARGPVFASDNRPAELLNAAKSGAYGSFLSGSFQWVTPFAKVPVNIPLEGFKRAPLVGAYDPAVQWKTLAEMGGRLDLNLKQRAVVMSLAKQSVGAAVVYLGLKAGEKGLASGGFPKDSREQGLFRERNMVGDAAKIGGFWYGMYMMGPYGLLFGAAATMASAWKQEEGGAGEKALAATGAGITATARIVRDMPLMQGPKELFDVIEEPDRKTARWIGRQVGSLVPSFLGAAARASDPVLDRDLSSDSFLGSAKGRIPGLRQTLPPKLTPLGRENRGPANPLLRTVREMVDVTGARRERTDELTAEFTRLGLGISPLEQRAGRKAHFTARGVYVPEKPAETDEEYADRRAFVDPIAEQELLDFVRSSEYLRLDGDPERQADRLSRTLSTLRRQASERYDRIMAQIQ